MGEASLETKMPSEKQARLNLEASFEASKTKPLGVSEEEVTAEPVKKIITPQQPTPETHWEEDGEMKAWPPNRLEGEAFQSQTQSNLGRKQE